MQERRQALCEPDRLVEAARYALLRRLAFALRHDLVTHLQPIGMITDLMERRLRAAAPDPAQLQEGMSRINGLARAAVQSCLEVVTWLAPEEDTVVALDAGVQECLALLRTSFNFRGFKLSDEIGATAFQVDRAGLRHVLPACLLALTDCAGSPADVVLSWEAGSPESEPAQAILSISVRPTDGAGGAPDSPYRLLEWHEIEALARAERIGLQRSGDCVRLTLSAASGNSAACTTPT